MNTHNHTWIEISTSALEHNFRAYKKIIGDQTMLGIVVKSNAYGHGIKEVSSIAQAHDDVQWLFTTTLSEALVLREHGITKPILVMCLLDADPAQAILHNIDVMVYDNATINTLNAIAQTLKKTAAVHIKIDTGMSRFGLYQQDALATIKHALQLPNILVRGIYTHFAESDHENLDFTHEQLKEFHQLLAELKKLSIDIPVKHAGNSAAAATLVDGRFDLVRVGGGAYGMWPSQATRTRTHELMPEFDLKQVMQWKAKILDIRSIPQDQYIGYSRTHQTDKPTRMALLPIGYFEGYDRRLSNKGTMIITDAQGNAHPAPVLGRVCMNVTMIDVSSIPGVKQGDDVTIIGDHELIKPTSIAQIIGSFNPREITTRINPAIPRILVA